MRGGCQKEVSHVHGQLLEESSLTPSVSYGIIIQRQIVEARLARLEGDMLDNRRELLLVKGEDKTDFVESMRYVGQKCDIQFKGSLRVYSYSARQVQRLRLVKVLDPATVIVKHQGKALAGVTALYDFGEWIRVERETAKARFFPKSQLVLEQNCLAKDYVKNLMSYLRVVADVISVTTEDDVRILSRQYQRISQISDKSVLAKHLSQQQPDSESVPPEKYSSSQMGRMLSCRV